MRILGEMYNIPIVELPPEEAFNPLALESSGTETPEPATVSAPLAARGTDLQHGALGASLPRAGQGPHAVSLARPTARR